MSAIYGEQSVVGAVRRAGWAVVNHEEQLTALDQAMGDGDLGITLSKIGQALIEYADSTPVDGDLGKWLGKAGHGRQQGGIVLVWHPAGDGADARRQGRDRHQ